MQSDDLGLVAKLRGELPNRVVGVTPISGIREIDFDWQKIKAERAEAAAAIERLVAERDEARRQFWLELREPGCVPERKGPWPHHMTAMTLREFMRERPEAFITVVSFVDGGPLLQDGPECLQMLDGRSMSTGRNHIKSSNAARARQALKDAP